ncbi:MAG: DUF3098 domain-containing protein [Bacteroidales bacterium]|jgi:hypothetical protein|nr:DUF3098 domain-containing protein [Bacteroidales bacterium]
MAQIINVEKTKPTKEMTEPSGSERKAPLFRKMNYILMIAAAVLLAIGYITLSGGGSKDPAVFSNEIFDTRHLVVAPILILAGLITGIFAIMYHPKHKD